MCTCLKLLAFLEVWSCWPGTPYDQELAVDIYLHSLHDGFVGFKMNYHMHGLMHSLKELYLKFAEKNMIIDSKKEVIAVNKGRWFKKLAKNMNDFQRKSKHVAKPKGGEKQKVVGRQ